MEPWPEPIHQPRGEDSKTKLSVSRQPPKSGVDIKRDMQGRNPKFMMKDTKETQKRINTLTIDAVSVSEVQNRGCVSQYMAFLRGLYGPDGTL